VAVAAALLLVTLWLVQLEVNKVREECRTQTAAKQLQSVAEMDDVSRHVHGDANRLHQVLHNQLNNAIKFTPAGQVVPAVRCLAAGMAAIVA
jgi:signal transduction histidine kinase